MTTLRGKVAIVTGGSREIGAAMAGALTQAGASVLIAHHHEPERAGAVVARLRAAGGQVLSADADLSGVAGNQRLVTQAVEAFGRLDIFVAHAGLTTWRPFLDVDAATWATAADLRRHPSASRPPWQMDLRH